MLAARVFHVEHPADAALERPPNARPARGNARRAGLA